MTRALKWISPVAVALIAGAVALAAALEFTGYMVLGGSSRFTVRDSQTRTSSDWLALGDTFRGYVVTGFDREGETLTLVRDLDTLRLPLRRVRDDRGRLRTPEAQILVTENGHALMQIVVGEDLQPSLNGQPFHFRRWDELCAEFARRQSDVVVRISYPTGMKPNGFSFWVTRITQGARSANLQTFKVVFE